MTTTLAENKDQIISDLLTDTDPTETGEGAVEIDTSNPNICKRCGYEMEKLQACKMRCPNCGAVQDCSDMGLTW